MSGRHQATEGRDQSTGLAKYNWTNSGSLWHVECDDCHNSHTARATNHGRGANGVSSSSPLYGSGGARATAYPGWAPGATGTYAYIEPIGVLRTSGTDFGVSYEEGEDDGLWLGSSWSICRLIILLVNPVATGTL